MARSSIWVRVSFEDRGWSGRLAPSGPDGMHVHFAKDDGPSDLPLGAEVSVGLAAPGMVAVVQDTARLGRVDHRREDVLVCVLELEHPERISAGVPGARIGPIPERRRWIRAEPTQDEAIVVPVTLPDAPPSAQRFLGRLLDGSAGGVALSFPRVAEAWLCRAPVLRAVVPLPGMTGAGEWVCAVRYRCLSPGDRVRYGLQFMSDGVAVDPPGPQLETLWDCRGCGTHGLLGQTHQYCPCCSTVARGPFRKPTWRDRATVAAHPLCASELECLGCGVAHADTDQVRFCGHCGRPVDATPRIQGRRSPGT